MAGEKRVQSQEESALEQNVILLDIEGTTTSISFVKDTLFAYVRENLKKYVNDKWDDEEFKNDLEKLKEQTKKDEDDKVIDLVPITCTSSDEEKESVVKNVLWQMDNDRKTGALKQLQGHIWREAYKSGVIKGHVYDDVKEALESWTSQDRKIYVYSSGSVEAQKLLFGHSEKGDLLKHFSGHFDTEMGPKQEAGSYKNIINKMGVEPSSVLFLTDIVKEAEAAKEAGLSATIVVREGNAPLSDEEKTKYSTIKTFLDLTFQSSSKRQKVDDIKPTEKPEIEKTETPKETVVEPMDTTDDAVLSETKLEQVKTEAKEVAEPETVDKAEAKVVEEVKSKEEQMEEKKDEVVEKEVTSEAKPKDVVKSVSQTQNDISEKKDADEVVPKEADKVEPVKKAAEEAEEAKEAIDEVAEKSAEKEKPVVAEAEKKAEKTEEQQPVAEKEDVKPEEKSIAKEEVTTNGVAEKEEKKKEEATELEKSVEEKPEEKSEVVSESKVEEATAETVEKKDVKEAKGESEEKKEENEEKKVVKETEEVEKKLNGEAKEEAKEEDKPHRNGTDAESQQEEKEKTKEGTSTAQNGESEDSTESIKVKKVVDPTVAADGAGEPDVVPPVAVAATS